MGTRWSNQESIFLSRTCIRSKSSVYKMFLAFGKYVLFSGLSSLSNYPTLTQDFSYLHGLFLARWDWRLQARDSEWTLNWSEHYPERTDKGEPSLPGGSRLCYRIVEFCCLKPSSSQGQDCQSIASHWGGLVKTSEFL